MQARDINFSASPPNIETAGKDFIPGELVRVLNIETFEQSSSRIKGHCQGNFAGFLVKIAWVEKRN